MGSWGLGRTKRASPRKPWEAATWPVGRTWHGPGEARPRACGATIVTMSWRGLYALTAVALLAAGCGTDEGSAPSEKSTPPGVEAPFVADGSLEAGPTSGWWGDGVSGPAGMHIGCIRDRQLAVLITVRNRTSRTIRLLGGGGPQPLRRAIERVAVQARLAPQVPADSRLPVGGLRAWSDRDSPPAAIPPDRSAWIQLNFLMRDCGSLPENTAQTVNRETTLMYEVDGRTGSQSVAVTSARIILTRGPLHPKFPINQVG